MEKTNQAQKSNETAKTVLLKDYRRPKPDFSPYNNYLRRLEKSFLGEDGAEPPSSPDILRGTWVVDPEDKETFEYLVSELDKFAKTHEGTITARIDSQKHYAFIDISIDFWELDTQGSFEFLKELGEKTHYLLFEPAPDNKLRIAVRIDYFRLIETEAEKSANKQEDPATLLFLRLVNIITETQTAKSDVEQRLCDLLYQLEKNKILKVIDAYTLIYKKIGEKFPTMEKLYAAAENLREHILADPDFEQLGYWE